MNAKAIALPLTVEKVLQKWPETFSIFIKHKTKCPGCFMQSFCTLNDVAESYQLRLEDLINEINQLANTTMSDGGSDEGLP